MKIKVSELTGAALDWAVAKCEGKTIHYFSDDPFRKEPWLSVNETVDQPLSSYTPSTDWAQGGPIIEREGLYLRANNDASEWVCGALSANRYDEKPGPLYRAEKPLVAAMRCYVASKLGDEVDIPEELA